MFVKKIKSKFTSDQKTFVKNILNNIAGYFVSNNLTLLAKIYESDKWGNHFYTPHYQSHFKKYRYKKIKLFEIGVGGYDSPIAGGSSLKMWKKYFPFGKIFAIDIYDKSKLEENRIKIFKGSQIDYPFLDSICELVGDFDLIIDDGSHVNEHVIKSFEFLFPKLKSADVPP